VELTILYFFYGIQ